MKSFSKEIENIKENQMEILELKNTNIRNSLDGHSGRMEKTEERNSNFTSVTVITFSLSRE